MMGTLRKLLKDRNLLLNTEKIKIMVFNKIKGNKEIWRCEGKDLEEVRSFKYLCFVYNTKGNFKDHIKCLKHKDRYGCK